MNKIPSNPGVGYEHEFIRLSGAGWLEPFRGKRILEIGPRHGVHSLQLATLEPSELVMVQRPEKHVWAVDPDDWLPEVQALCPARLIMGDVVYLEDAALADPFDLVWCCGVIYHNVEQVRLLRRLFDLLEVGGGLVLESEVIRKKDLPQGLYNVPVVRVYYPETWHGKPTITHLPSLSALQSWLDMVGFTEVQRWQKVWPEKGGRALLTARKRRKTIRYEYAKESGRTRGKLERRDNPTPGQEWRID